MYIFISHLLMWLRNVQYLITKTRFFWLRLKLSVVRLLASLLNGVVTQYRYCWDRCKTFPSLIGHPIYIFYCKYFTSVWQYLMIHSACLAVCVGPLFDVLTQEETCTCRHYLAQEGRLKLYVRIAVNSLPVRSQCTLSALSVHGMLCVGSWRLGT